MNIDDGTWSPPEGIDIDARLLLQEMKMPDVLRVATPMVSSISVDDHIQGWEKQKEQISSAPEGLHFGHYKAGTLDEDIAEFDAIMRSLPYEHGFAPDGWKGIVDVEILKKAGVYDIEKMRTKSGQGTKLIGIRTFQNRISDVVLAEDRLKCSIKNICEVVERI